MMGFAAARVSRASAEMLAIPAITLEYGKNCIAAERHFGLCVSSFDFRVFSLHSLGVSAFKNLAV